MITNARSSGRKVWRLICSAKKGCPSSSSIRPPPIGPRDTKPTPTGQIIVDFLNKKLPAYLETGLNWVHVRDVAAGHILAAQKGLIGQRYILGNAQGNWTMEETLATLEEITGIAAPKQKFRTGSRLPPRTSTKALPSSPKNRPSL
jgi:nucleoside-diphosphate-sugar epimerase